MNEYQDVGVAWLAGRTGVAHPCGNTASLIAWFRGFALACLEARGEKSE